MRRSTLPVPLLALLLVVGGARAVRASRSDARAALQALVRGVEARQGTQHRSLVVVALVAREPGDAGGPALATPGLGWSPAAVGSVAIDAAEAAEERLLPTGTLLGEGPRARVLARPVRLPTGTRAVAAAVRVPSGLAIGADPARTFTGLAGPEVRHVVTIAPHPDALGELITLERFLAGLPDGDVPAPFLAIRNGPRIATARAQGVQALGALATAYGGETCGYVAFLGHRPVEIALAGTPAIHAARVRDAGEGLATHLALWEELYGRGDDPVDAVAWPRALEVTGRLLDDLARASVRKTDAADCWRLGTKTASRLGWLLLGGADHALLLEAWPLGDAGPFPVPAREPGGRPIDERPDPILQGTVTREFLERYRERLERIRRGLDLR